MTMIDLAKKKEPLNGRLVQYLLKELVIDGGKNMSYKNSYDLIIKKVNGICWLIW